MEIKGKWSDPDEWEDVKNGLYDSVTRPDIIEKCKILFSDKNIYELMKDAVISYKISSIANMSYNKLNRRPWIGQVLCSYHAGATLPEVNKAWKEITSKERDIANQKADEVIKYWEENIYETL